MDYKCNTGSIKRLEIPANNQNEVACSLEDEKLTLYDRLDIEAY